MPSRADFKCVFKSFPQPVETRDLYNSPVLEGNPYQALIIDNRTNRVPNKPVDSYMMVLMVDTGTIPDAFTFSVNSAGVPKVIQKTSKKANDKSPKKTAKKAIKGE